MCWVVQRPVKRATEVGKFTSYHWVSTFLTSEQLTVCSNFTRQLIVKEKYSIRMSITIIMFITIAYDNNLVYQV